MDVEQSYLRYQDFGMALATTIVILLLSSLLRLLIDGSKWGAFVQGSIVVLGWIYSVYLTLDAIRTQKLDRYSSDRPFRQRLRIGIIVAIIQIAIGVTYAIN